VVSVVAVVSVTSVINADPVAVLVSVVAVVCSVVCSVVTTTAESAATSNAKVVVSASVSKLTINADPALSNGMAEQR